MSVRKKKPKSPPLIQTSALPGNIEKCPTEFYRYRSLSGETAAEYVRRTLLENELYFAKPSSFNDPFDCYPSFEFEATDGEIVAYYTRILRRNFPQLSEKQLLSEALRWLHDLEQGPRSPKFLETVQELHGNNITEKIGVLSLSEVFDDILMWSHYADFHRGICLQFDGYFPFFANAHQVSYRLERARINPFRHSTDEMMEVALLAKAEHWSYEKEWRIIQYRQGPGIYRFPPEALTGVVLGSRISPLNEEKVLAWVKARKVPTKVLRAFVSRTTYSLEIL